MAIEFHNQLKMNENKITGLAAPTANTDAANKAYVDGKAAPVTKVNNKDGIVVLTAEDIGYTPITDFPTTPNTTPNDVQKAINNLFTYANSGKNNVAGSIGYTPPYSGTFASLAGNIDTATTDLKAFLPNAEQTVLTTDKLHDLTAKLDNVRVFKNRVKLYKTTTQTETIILNTQVPADKIVVTPLQLINDDAITPQAVQVGFTNTAEDIDDFVSNTNLSFANNRVHIPIVTTTDNLTTVSTESNGTIKETVVNLSNKKAFRVTALTNDTITYQTFVFAQVLKASGDINLTNVGNLTGFDFVSFPTAANNGTIPSVGVFLGYALSFDGGSTWWGKPVNNQSGDFVQIQNIDDANSFYGRIIRLSNLRDINGGAMGTNNPEYAKLNALRNDSNTLRLAYFIDRPDFDTETYFDTMNLYANLKGALAPTTNVSTTYNQTTKTITCTFNTSDTFQINWIDTP